VQPLVVGVAALLLSVTQGKLKPAELEDIIVKTAVKKSSLTEKCATGVRRAGGGGGAQGRELQGREVQG